MSHDGHDVDRTADFRSDKVARPTQEMVRAMGEAEWGDGQDDPGPTVNRLERLAAELTGKERGLFVISGIMANQLAVAAHTRPGKVIVIDDQGHIATTETGFAERLSGVRTVTLSVRDGRMDLNDLRCLFERNDEVPSLVCVENTHNVQGGRVVPLDYLNAVRDLAHAHGAKVHLDGARITNAHVKSGIAIAEYASYADSVMFCLSKGLCAPAGSMLCGAAELIERGVEVRQTFGGFPKQAAPLAAAGIVAIDKMIPRLAEDHDNATRLAQGLRAVDGVEQHLDIEDVETNMVFVRVKSMDADAFVDALASRGVLAYHFGGGRVRFVTHRDVTASHVERAISVITEVLKENGEKPAKRGTDVT